MRTMRSPSTSCTIIIIYSITMKTVKITDLKSFHMYRARARTIFFIMTIIVRQYHVHYTNVVRVRSDGFRTFENGRREFKRTIATGRQYNAICDGLGRPFTNRLFDIDSGSLAQTQTRNVQYFVRSPFAIARTATPFTSTRVFLFYEKSR